MLGIFLKVFITTFLAIVMVATAAGAQQAGGTPTTTPTTQQSTTTTTQTTTSPQPATTSPNEGAFDKLSRVTRRSPVRCSRPRRRTRRPQLPTLSPWTTSPR